MTGKGRNQGRSPTQEGPGAGTREAARIHTNPRKRIRVDLCPRQPGVTLELLAPATDEPPAKRRHELRKKGFERSGNNQHGLKQTGGVPGQKRRDVSQDTTKPLRSPGAREVVAEWSLRNGAPFPGGRRKRRKAQAGDKRHDGTNRPRLNVISAPGATRRPGSGRSERKGRECRLRPFKLV